MIAVSDLSRKLGDYQRPYLTVFRIERLPNFGVSPDEDRARKAAISALDVLRDAYDYKLGLKSPDLSDPNAIGTVIDEYHNRLQKVNDAIDRVNMTRRELRKAKANSPANPSAHYRLFNFIKENIDIYSLRTVMPDRKSEMNSFWWEGEQFFYPGRDASQKSAEFTFILDQDMLLLPFLYVMKDLTSTTSGQFRASRGNVVKGEYEQEFDFGIFQIATDRNIITGYAQLQGVRVYEVSGIKVDKSDTGATVQTVTAKVGWDYTNWDDSEIGRPWIPSSSSGRS